MTNVLRHSQATTCQIRAFVHDSLVVLEVENDGVGAPAPPGNGLLGLTERARAVGGSLVVRSLDAGRFGLRLEVPPDVPVEVTPQAPGQAPGQVPRQDPRPVIA